MKHPETLTQEEIQALPSWDDLARKALDSREKLGLTDRKGAPNIPLLRKAVEWVEGQEALNEGREWHQADWVVFPSLSSIQRGGWCETAFCVAGKIAFDLGWNIEMEKTSEAFMGPKGQEERVYAYASTIMSKTITDENGDQEKVYAYASDIAEQALGQRYVDQPHYVGDLFGGGNTAADIRRIAETIAGEKL